MAQPSALGALSWIRLHLLPGRGKHHLVLADARSDKYFDLEPGIASQIWRNQNLVKGRKAELRDEPAPGSVEQALKFTSWLAEESRLQTRKQINPLFLQIRLFEVAPYQQSLSTLAALLYSRGALALVALLAFLGLMMSVANDWAILKSPEASLSTETLLLFALLTPFLKVFHEFGHVLAATRHGVPVRHCGFFLSASFRCRSSTAARPSCSNRANSG